MIDWARASRLAIRYRHLASMVARHGVRYPKQHGSWIKLSLTPDVCLTMDSWNSAIHLMQEPAPYLNDVQGFAGPKSTYVGIDFGSIEVKVTEARLESIIRATDAALASRGTEP